MTITLPPAAEARLQSEAARRGVAAVDLATELILEHLPPAAVPSDEDDDDVPELRGVVPIEIEREHLFTRPLSVRIEDLPEWRPHIGFDRRMIEDDEDGDD